MSNPEGMLTGAQLDVMRAVWAAGEQGITVAETCSALKEEKAWARTTVQTLVTRLEKRGWLRSEMRGNTKIYFATRGREETSGQVARSLIDDFFGGSASRLVMSLLGSEKIEEAEVQRLRDLLGESEKEGGE